MTGKMIPLWWIGAKGQAPPSIQAKFLLVEEPQAGIRRIGVHDCPSTGVEFRLTAAED
jgi:hypothetical protein